MPKNHPGLTLLGETSDNAVLAGSLADCMALAKTHGMEVERYEGRIVSSENGKAIYTPADENNFAICYFKDRGIILKGRDDFSMTVPMHLWRA